ncbi:MAG: VirB4 family type IV secretion system protein [Chloroflexota bacterium]
MPATLQSVPVARGELTIADRVAPGDYMRVDGSTILLNGIYGRIWAVHNFPSTIKSGALHELYYQQPYPVKVSINWHHEQGMLTHAKARRVLTEIEAERWRKMEKGILRDARADVQANELERQIEEHDVSGEPFVWVSMLVAVFAPRTEELSQAAAWIENWFSVHGFMAQPVWEEQDKALETIMPTGSRTVYPTRNFSHSALATLYPHGVREYDEDRGILLGTYPGRLSLVRVDPFRAVNTTAVVTGQMGMGKSVLVKTAVEQAAIAGDDVSVIDMAGEYVNLVRHLGGQIIEMCADQSISVNVLDPTLSDDAEQAFASLVAVLSIMGEQDITGETRAVLQETHSQIRRRRGGGRLSHLLPLLATHDETRSLAKALRPFTCHPLNRFFDRPTNVPLTSALRCFVLTGAIDAKGPAGRALLYLTQKFGMQRGLAKPGQRSWTFLDEGWVHFQDQRDAGKMVELATNARKATHMLVIVAPNIGQIAAERAGRILLQNAATHIIMKQDENVLEQYKHIALAILNEADVGMATRQPVGHGLLIMNRGAETLRTRFKVDMPPGREMLYGSQTDPSLKHTGHLRSRDGELAA